jgi:perosamine synthetase
MTRALPRGSVYHRPGYDLRQGLRLLRRGRGDPRDIPLLERAFAAQLGRAHCVAFPLARTAVWAALRAAELPRGGRILMPAITIKPMMDVVIDRGLEPSFTDVELERYGPDPQAWREGLDGACAAMLTPLYGLAPDMEPLLAAARERGVFLIEDISHALNARWRGAPLGSFGDVAIYSSSTVKTFDTFGGGLAVTDDGDMAARLRAVQGELLPASRRELARKLIINAGRGLATEPAVFGWTAWPLLQWSREHSPALYRWLSGYVEANDRPVAPIPEAWRRRYTGFQAQAGLELLPRVAGDDEARVRNARQLLERLRGCPGLTLPQPHPQAEDVWWQLVVLADEPEHLMEGLAQRDIDSATGNLDLIGELDLYPPYRTATPQARRLKQHGVFLPIHPSLGPADMERVAAAVWEVCGGVTATLRRP